MASNPNPNPGPNPSPNPSPNPDPSPSPSPSPNPNQITDILLEIMRLQPRTNDLPSPVEHSAGRASAGRASGRRASCPGSACPSTARAVKNLERQLSMDLLSTPRLLGTPRRPLAHLAAPPPALAALGSLTAPQVLYSELMRVREEADSLRRDVASQHALQQASQTEL